MREMGVMRMKKTKETLRLEEDNRMLEMNKLHCVDCMDAMRDIPDNFFDLCIVDPPYGVCSITYASGERKRAKGGYIDSYNVTMGVLDMHQRSSLKKKLLPDILHCGKKNNHGRWRRKRISSPRIF